MAAANDPAGRLRTWLIPSCAQPARALPPAAAASPAPAACKAHIVTPYQIGKFTISSLARRDESGRYRSSLSIRSGRGSMTRDRVFRFAPTFDSPDEASRFADAQARACLLEVSSTPAPSTLAE